MAILAIPFEARVTANSEAILKSFEEMHTREGVYNAGHHLLILCTPNTEAKAEYVYREISKYFQKSKILLCSSVSVGDFAAVNSMFISALDFIESEYRDSVKDIPVIWYGEKANTLFNKSQATNGLLVEWMDTVESLFMHQNRRVIGGPLHKLPNIQAYNLRGELQDMDGGYTVGGTFAFSYQLRPKIGGLMTLLSQCHPNINFRMYLKSELTQDYNEIPGWGEINPVNTGYIEAQAMRSTGVVQTTAAPSVNTISEIDLVTRESRKPSSKLEVNAPPAGLEQAYNNAVVPGVRGMDLPRMNPLPVSGSEYIPAGASLGVVSPGNVRMDDDDGYELKHRATPNGAVPTTQNVAVTEPDVTNGTEGAETATHQEATATPAKNKGGRPRKNS